VTSFIVVLLLIFLAVGLAFGVNLLIQMNAKLDTLLLRSAPNQPEPAVTLGLTAGPITEQPDLRRR
jgi:hypothetical protein